jgi:uncharacterized membrane protein YgaE (UPF0421/DUF939 family)
MMPRSAIAPRPSGSRRLTQASRLAEATVGSERVSQGGRALRGSARRRVDRVAGAWFSIALTAAAAGLAWYLARLIVGQPLPFFAPASAVLSLGLTRGQPRRRAAELVIGVAIGLAIAGLWGRVLGTGPVQIAVVVALAMAAALLIGAGTMLINQAAISAVLVMTLPTNDQGAAPDRFFDALIGGAVALLLSQVLSRRDPITVIARAARPALDELAASLRETASALGNRNLQEAERALQRARGIDDEVSLFYDALDAAREAAWLTPPQRRAGSALQLYAEAARQVDYAVRNARVLARSAVAALRKNVDVDPELAVSVRTLAEAADELAVQFANPARTDQTRRLAARAAEQATVVLDRRRDLCTNMIVGQVRAAAMDLLRGSGLDSEDARRAMETTGTCAEA